MDAILPFQTDSYRGRRQVNFSHNQILDKDTELLDMLVKTDGFLIVRFIKEPWVGLKQLEEFLEISPEISEENFFFNATKVDF